MIIILPLAVHEIILEKKNTKKKVKDLVDASSDSHLMLRGWRVGGKRG